MAIRGMGGQVLYNSEAECARDQQTRDVDHDIMRNIAGKGMGG